ncbi:IPT/TIG domain-containing protein [Pseudoxanthomonas winnipegensis]|uniref:beta strand repeat-containing protein n=1 Tax=Pseudoxanthomonas winnipegensis TaxID=2480810 RepID=UPI003CE4B704|nr:IPT/TIG domain-containing protein [Pseudoxanthomonas winnipegensis]
MVAVSDDTGASARYTYDRIGNLLAVDRFAAGQLAVFAFAPARGAAGITVKIKGQGFSTTASQNTVKFNGTSATVSAATATELTTTVPSGATTGPISVTVGTATAASTGSFTVDPGAGGPTITSVAPTLVAIGDAITVTGTRLSPVAGQTSTLLNGLPVATGTLSNTQIVFPAPANVGSGKVSVVTPYGVATSSQDVVVLPAGVAVADIASVKRLTLGAAAQSLSVNTSGKSLAVLYDASLGDFPSLQFSALGDLSINYSVYSQTNVQLAYGTVTANTPTAHLPKASSSATYLVLLSPSQAPATWKMAIEKAPSLGVNGSSLVQGVTAAGQSKRIIFVATTRQNLGFALSDLVFPNATNWVSADFRIYDPDGNFVTSGWCYAEYGGCQANLSDTLAGTYSVVITPPGDGDRTMSFKSTLSTDLTGTLQTDVVQTVNLSRRGQNARLSFSGTAGKTVALQVAGQSTTPVDQPVYYTVYQPDGTQLASVSTTSAATLNLPNLPATGTYLVFVDPSSGETASAQVMLASGTTGGQVTNGASGSFTTTVPGQNVYLTFSATAGQNLGFALSDLMTPNATGYVYLNVFSPDGGAAASQVCYASDGGCQVNLPGTVAGTYSVVVSPPSDGDRTMSFKSTLSTDLTGTLQSDVAQTINLTRRGQNARLSFAGTAGKTVALQVAGQSTTPAERWVYYTVYNPDGTQLSSVNATSAATLNLPNLPMTGTYQVFVDPGYGEAATAQVMLASGTTGGQVTNGATGSFTTTVSGQNVYLTFSATAGQNLGFALSDLVTPNATGYVYLNVFSPDGGTAASQVCYASDAGCQVNLPGTVGGTYSVVVSPPSDGDRTMSFKSTLSTDLTAALTVNTAKALSVTRRGQNGRLTFSGTAGQTMALRVSNQSTGPVDRDVYYTVLAPDGSSVDSMSVRTEGTLNLPGLPASGTYTVFVDPNYGETVSSSVLVASGVTGTSTTGGATGSYSTTIPGQNIYLTFSATAGQNLGFALSDLVTPNATGYVYLNVFSPDGGTAASQVCYATNAGCQVNLPGTVVGTYSVVVSPPSDGNRTMSFKSTLSADVTGALTVNTAKALSVTRRGQNGRLTFSGTAGQTVVLRVANQTTVPVDRYVYYTVLAPDGSSVGSMSVTNEGTLNLPGLPASGTYTVFVDPAFGETVSSSVLVASGVTGAPTTGGATGSYSTTVPGQNVYLTFTATAGQNLGLGLSDLATPNSSYVSLVVYGPDGSYAASETCYSSNNGCQVNLPNTSAGTYSVVVSAPYDGDRTMSFKSTLSADVTGTLTVNTTKTLSVTRRGQNGRLTFSGTAGQTVVLRVANQTTVPADRYVYYTVLAPDGSSVGSMSVTNEGTLNLHGLPASGTYTVFVDPASGETVSSSVLVASGVTGTQTTGGATGSYSTTVPSQNVYLTFTATAGQNLGLGLSDLVTPNANYTFLTVYAPNGDYAAGETCYQSNSGCQVNLPGTIAGTYSVVINAPPDGDRTMSFKSTLSADVTGTLTVNTTKALSVTRRGQNGRLTFSGTAGQTVALRVANQSTGPADRGVYYTVLAPDGSTVSSMSVNSEGTLNLQGLPASGTYTVFVDPYYGETVSSSVLVASGVTGTSTTGGATGSYSTTVPGQNVYLTFTATAGQNLGFALSDMVTPNSTYVYLVFYDPDGGYASSLYCYQSNNGCQINLPNTVAGTYSATVSPPSDGDRTMSFKSTLSADVTGTLAVNTAKALSVTRRGQNGRLTFSGTAGQSLMLQVTGQTTNPTSRDVYYSVYNPDGTYLNSTYGQTSASLPLEQLPVTGTYTVFVDPYYGETVSANLLLKPSN